MQIFANMKQLGDSLINFLRRRRYLLAAGGAVLLFSCFPSAVEHYYSRGIYPLFSVPLRWFTSLVPFSWGDLLYAGITLFAIFFLTRFLFLFVVEKKSIYWMRSIELGVVGMLWLYLIFKLFWGLHYDRPSVGETWKMGEAKYTLKELSDLNDHLIGELNSQRASIPGDSLPSLTFPEIRQLTIRAYQSISKQYPELDWKFPSLKNSMFAAFGDWIGYTGYYNPFTGEAQIRGELPAIILPYIACHEAAHQIGYARESEASFIGWLAATSAEDARLRYSAALDIYDQVQMELWRMHALEGDSAGLRKQLQENARRLDTLVKSDRQAIRDFFRKRRHRVTPAFNEMYAQYLRMNGQSGGLQSYREVVGWVLAYERTNGKKK